MYQPVALTTSERYIWDAVKIFGESCLSTIRKETEAATGLSGADFDVLFYLADARKGKLTQQGLQSWLNWDKSRLSHHLTRMEARQLVKRESAKSGRNVLVRILPKGRRCITEALPVHAKAVRRRLLQHLSAEEGKAIMHASLNVHAGLGFS